MHTMDFFNLLVELKKLMFLQAVWKHANYFVQYTTSLTYRCNNVSK